MKELLKSIVFRKLSTRIGTLIIVTEAVVLFGLGLFYITRFTKQLENSVQQKFQSPGHLMSKGLLSYESAEDKTTMENLVGETIDNCMIIGADGNVYFASNPEFKGKKRVDISVLKGFSQLENETKDPVFLNVTENGDRFFVIIHPLRLEDGKFLGHLFIHARMDRVLKEK